MFTIKNDPNELQLKIEGPGLLGRVKNRLLDAAIGVLSYPEPESEPNPLDDVYRGMAEATDMMADDLAGARALIAELEARLDEMEAEQRRNTQPAGPISQRAAATMAADPLFLDYETTGIRRLAYEDYAGKRQSEFHQVVEVAVVNSAGQVIFESLVNPERDIPEKAQAVNGGISAAMVADAPTWAEIEPLLADILSGRTVVAHNAKFEQAFTPSDWDINWICSMEIADQAFGKASWFEVQDDPGLSSSLAGRLAYCGLDPSGDSHQAANDARDSLRLVKYLAGMPV